MSTDPWRRYGGWAALAAGTIQILGLILLILFFALEAPQGVASRYRFGFLSDLLPIPAAVAALVVVFGLFQLERKQVPGWSAVALLPGVAGYVVVAATNLLFVLQRITLNDQIRLFYISMAPLGLWQILVSALARRGGLLPRRLTGFGLLVGLGQVITFVVFYLLDGYNAMFSSSVAEITANVPLLIALVIGIPMTLIGYLGAPFWLVWLGQVLLRGEEVSEALGSFTTEITDHTEKIS